MMKKILLLTGLMGCIFSAAQAKVTVPDGRYVFPFTKATGPVRILNITFHSETKKGEQLYADVEGTLENGKKMSGSLKCDTKGDVITCKREDDGGGFQLLISQLTSNENLQKYTFKSDYFTLSEEGDDLIEIRETDKSGNDIPITVTGKKEVTKAGAAGSAATGAN